MSGPWTADDVRSLYTHESSCYSTAWELKDSIDQIASQLEAQEARLSALEQALEEIRELNLENEDEIGHRWANSDMINQTIVLTLSKTINTEKANTK